MAGEDLLHPHLLANSAWRPGPLSTQSLDRCPREGRGPHWNPLPALRKRKLNFNEQATMYQQFKFSPFCRNLSLPKLFYTAVHVGIYASKFFPIFNTWPLCVNYFHKKRNF